MVFSYGGIELLRVGETFHSRTRKAYTSMHGLHKDSLCFYGFYLKIPDYRVPKLSLIHILQDIITTKRELLNRETYSRNPINYSAGMAEET